MKPAQPSRPVGTKEFVSRMEVALSGYGWMARLARGLGKDYSTVKRWANGSQPVPDYAVATLELIEWLRAQGVTHLPARFDPN